MTWRKGGCSPWRGKFENNPEIKERYAKSIEDDIEKGYVKKLSKDEVQCESSVVWYLTHRFVINPKKPDRLRRVYDASAKFMGQSLNDKIYTGSDLLSSSVWSLPQVLRRENCYGCRCERNVSYASPT